MDVKWSNKKNQIWDVCTNYNNELPWKYIKKTYTEVILKTC